MIRDHSTLRVLLIAENASEKFGGEAVIPLFYFRNLRKRGITVKLLTHCRVQQELEEIFPGSSDQEIFFSPDTFWHIVMWKIGGFLPDRLAYFTTGLLSRLATQFLQRRIAKKLIDEFRLTLIHQPIPVSPKEPSLIFSLGIPVIIGPMNGGMEFPQEFKRKSAIAKIVGAFGLIFSEVLNIVIPGKRRAKLLLISNLRTKYALPTMASNTYIILPENGIELPDWQFKQYDKNTAVASKPIRFVFLGRLIWLKGVDLLLKAFAKIKDAYPITLLIVGDGPEKGQLMETAHNLGILSDQTDLIGKVSFYGWRKQHEIAQLLRSQDCFVFPSMMECGGAAVLEAMATGLPVIATNWGGPSEYLDLSCGILIPPCKPEEYIEKLAYEMCYLAKNTTVRQEMGRAGREKVEQLYSWEKKIDNILEIYMECIDGNQANLSTNYSDYSDAV